MEDIIRLAYLSKTPGIGGTIKQKPEDFTVEEIMQDGTMLELDKSCTRSEEEGDFTHFVLQKKEWTTEGALRRIGDALAIGKKRFSYAGSKDKNAKTVQLASVYGIDKEKLLSLNLKDIKILGAWSAKDKVRLGQLAGNRFTIKASGIETADAEKAVKKIFAETNGMFPNYFGGQRFGSSRKNTHKVGETLLRGRADLAVMEFLCGSCASEEREESRIAREELAKTNDFGAALRNFPKSLRLERSVLAHLAKYPRDYAGALRRLPRATLLLFVHAFQSHLFNIMLSERMGEGELKAEEGEYCCGEKDGFPDISRRIEKKLAGKTFLVGKIIGYETKPNEREKTLLAQLDIKTSDFRLRFMPEIATAGSYRVLLAPLKDFSFKEDTFMFSLPAGSYATMAVREFLDKDKG